MTQKVLYDVSLLSDDDLYLFNEGNHFRLYLKLGARPLTVNDTQGTYFAVWAPDAEKVFVIGLACGGLLENGKLQERCLRCSIRIPIVYDDLIGEPPDVEVSDEGSGRTIALFRATQMILLPRS